MACVETASLPPSPDAPAPPVRTQTEATLDLSAITGRWRSEGEAFVQYRFDGDRYVATGHPAFDESGRIAIVRADAEVLEVQLIDRIHNGQADAPLTLRIEPRPDRLVIDGEPFLPAVPQVAAAADAEAQIADEITGE